MHRCAFEHSAARQQGQLVTPGLLLALSYAAASSEMWPPPDNVFDDDAKYFVRVHALHAGPFNISKFYFGPTCRRKLTVLGTCGHMCKVVCKAKTVAAHVRFTPAKNLAEDSYQDASFPLPAARTRRPVQHVE